MSLQFYGYILGNGSMFNRDITRFLSVENYSRVPASCRGTSRRWRMSCASSLRPNPRWSSCNTPWDTMRMRSSRVQGTTWGWRLKILKFETYGLGWNNVKFTTGVFCLFWGWTWLNMAKACYNNKKDTFCGLLFFYQKSVEVVWAPILLRKGDADSLGLKTMPKLPLRQDRDRHVFLHVLPPAV